jgi:hypothetical protein
MTVAHIGERFIFGVNKGPSLPRTALPSPSQGSATRKNGGQSARRPAAIVELSSMFVVLLLAADVD